VNTKDNTLNIFSFIKTVVVTGLLLASVSLQAAVVKTGDIVDIQYTLTLVNGKQIAASRTGQPMRVEVGKNTTFPLVEITLLNMKVGDEKKVILQPKHAYGLIDPKRIRTVDLNKLPKKSRKVGATLFATAPDGKEQEVLVQSINGDKAVLNFNHPLAGQTLFFNMKVLSIKPK